MRTGLVKLIKSKKRRAADPYYSFYLISKIKDKKNLESTLNVAGLDNYRLILTDDSIENPYVINSDLVGVIRKHTKPHNNKLDKARAVYDWMVDNIKYGSKTRRQRNVGYKSSDEVIRDKEGICGEMAYLYITMARCCGLKSSFVCVDRDFRNKPVSHACASVDVGPRMVLVDPAYNSFDIKHMKYHIISDREVLEMFDQWR